jgi:methionyl aminopeptidase
MIVLKTGRDLETLRRAARVAASVLDEVCAHVQPGMTTRELDDFVAAKIRHYGARSAFLGYRQGRLKYPCHACISVNEQVVHGIAGSRRLVYGDIVSVDVGVIFEGFIGDNARTVPVGGCGLAAQQLLEVTEECLHLAIQQAVPGNRVADISAAVQNHAEAHGYSIVREFVGHGVGRQMHEDPQVPNYVERGKSSPKLVPGMTLAIEPMVNAGTADVVRHKDGWTVSTADASLSAHFEHTVLITEGDPEILTCLSSFAPKAS